MCEWALRQHVSMVLVYVGVNHQLMRSYIINPVVADSRIHQPVAYAQGARRYLHCGAGGAGRIHGPAAHVEPDFTGQSVRWWWPVGAFLGLSCVEWTQLELSRLAGGMDRSRYATARRWPAAKDRSPRRRAFPFTLAGWGSC